MFTFGTNSLTVLLTDTVVNPGDVSYNLSGFKFDLAGATGGALTGASSPNSRTVNQDKTYTDAAGPTTVADVGWVYSQSSSIYKLDVLSGTGHAGPENTIIGAPGSGGTYSNANGSIKGNDPHNPFLAQSATFTFSFTGGVTANSLSSLSNVMFQFGTTDNQFQLGSCTAGCIVTTVPEPETYAMVLSGLGLLGFVARRRRRTA